MARVKIHTVDHPQKAEGLVAALRQSKLQVDLVSTDGHVEIHVSTRKRGVTSAQLTQQVMGALAAHVCRPNQQYALSHQRGPRRPFLL